MEWGVFLVAIAGLLCLEGLVLRGPAARVAGCVAVASAYAAFLWAVRGPDAGVKFLTGYVLEASLSLDNVFVMSLIFTALAIPSHLRGRVLSVGIWTAMVLRGVFIAAGSALVGRFDWLLLICGAFLVFTGCKLLFGGGGEAEVDLEKNRAYRLLARVVPLTPHFHDDRFFVRYAGGAKRGKLHWITHATPLLVALVLVEIADVVFAADSVPATLAVTTDPLLVYTSNIFAIMGLRALFLVLEAAVNRFAYMGRAVALVLVFVGAKVVAAHLLHFEVPNLISLGVVVCTLAVGMIASLRGSQDAPRP